MASAGAGQVSSHPGPERRSRVLHRKGSPRRRPPTDLPRLLSPGWSAPPLLCWPGQGKGHPSPHCPKPGDLWAGHGADLPSPCMSWLLGKKSNFLLLLRLVWAWVCGAVGTWRPEDTAGQKQPLRGPGITEAGRTPFLPGSSPQGLCSLGVPREATRALLCSSTLSPRRRRPETTVDKEGRRRGAARPPQAPGIACLHYPQRNGCEEGNATQIHFLTPLLDDSGTQKPQKWLRFRHHGPAVARHHGSRGRGTLSPFSAQLLRPSGPRSAPRHGAPQSQTPEGPTPSPGGSVPGVPSSTRAPVPLAVSRTASLTMSVSSDAGPERDTVATMCEPGRDG